MAPAIPNQDLLEDGTRVYRVGGSWIPEEALLEGREAAGLSDEDVSDLAHLNADEEDSVAGVLLVQALPERLRVGRGQKQTEPAQPRPTAPCITCSSQISGLTNRADQLLPWGKEYKVSCAPERGCLGKGSKSRVQQLQREADGQHNRVDQAGLRIWPHSIQFFNYL